MSERHALDRKYIKHKDPTERRVYLASAVNKHNYFNIMRLQCERTKSKRNETKWNGTNTKIIRRRKKIRDNFRLNRIFSENVMKAFWFAKYNVNLYCKMVNRASERTTTTEISHQHQFQH